MPLYKIVYTQTIEVKASDKDSAWDAWDNGEGDVAYESSQIQDENGNTLERRVS